MAMHLENINRICNLLKGLIEIALTKQSVNQLIKLENSWKMTALARETKTFRIQKLHVNIMR